MSVVWVRRSGFSEFLGLQWTHLSCSMHKLSENSRDPLTCIWELSQTEVDLTSQQVEREIILRIQKSVEIFKSPWQNSLLVSVISYLGFVLRLSTVFTQGADPFDSPD